MELLPESIQSTQTLALDHTFRERLLSLAVDQLAIAPEQERDLRKLTLYLRQFGIPVELFPDLGAIQLRDLLRRVLLIYCLSGTPRSIELLAEALGATSATVVRDAFLLDHARQALHDGRHRYDAGRQHRSFCCRCKGGGHKRGRMADLYDCFSSPLPGFSTRERAFATSGAASRQPIVLNRTEAFTIASARIADTGISFGAWCGLWLTNRT